MSVSCAELNTPTKKRQKHKLSAEVSKLMERKTEKNDKDRSFGDV